MKELVDKYEDPVKVEIQVTAEVIKKAEEEPSEPAPAPAPAPAAPAVDVDIVEAQRLEAQRIKQEEEEKLAAMDEGEREAYMRQMADAAKHNADKDRMLKSQLNVYSASGANPLLAGRGRGRGRGKRPVSTTPGGTSEYIVSGRNEDGQWQVNPEE